MLFTLGKIFFPHLIHQEKRLRKRMLWIMAGMALLLMAAVVLGMYRLNNRRFQVEQPVKRFNGR